MPFSVKKSEAPNAGGDGIYMRAFPKGETVVRFLEEPDDWRLYYEHFIGQQSFPCTGETDSCPGCTNEVEDVRRRSRKYGTFAFNPKWNDVVPYKLPMTLANRLTNRAEKNDGTLTNRDYVVLKSGEGLRTEYDVDSDEKYSLDIDALRQKAPVKTVDEVLEAMFRDVWGDPAQYSSDTEPKGRPTTRKIADEPVPDALKTKAELEFHAAQLREAEAPKDEDEVTEAELRGMTRKALEEVWIKAGWDGYDDNWSKSELLNAILAKAD